MCVMDLSEATNMLKVNLSGFKTEAKEVQLVTKKNVGLLFLKQLVFKWKFPIENARKKPKPTTTTTKNLPTHNCQ